jgi:hypothetical protein
MLAFEHCYLNFRSDFEAPQTFKVETLLDLRGLGAASSTGTYLQYASSWRHYSDQPE